MLHRLFPRYLLSSKHALLNELKSKLAVAEVDKNLAESNCKVLQQKQAVVEGKLRGLVEQHAIA